jgi:hypothetical protein
MRQHGVAVVRGAQLHPPVQPGPAQRFRGGGPRRGVQVDAEQPPEVPISTTVCAFIARSTAASTAAASGARFRRRRNRSGSAASYAASLGVQVVAMRRTVSSIGEISLLDRIMPL